MAPSLAMTDIYSYLLPVSQKLYAITSLARMWERKKTRDLESGTQDNLFSRCKRFFSDSGKG